MYKSIDMTESRVHLADNGTVRAAYMASFLSPAALFSGTQIADFHEGLFPLCHTQLGTYGHILWSCPNNRFNFGVPENPLQKRFGWCVYGNDSNSNVVNHFMHTIDKIWDIRHSRSTNRFHEHYDYG